MLVAIAAWYPDKKPFVAKRVCHAETVCRKLPGGACLLCPRAGDKRALHCLGRLLDIVVGRLARRHCLGRLCAWLSRLICTNMVVLTRQQSRRGFMGFDNLSDIAWSVIFDHLDDKSAFIAEGVNCVFLDAMRTHRTCLKLPRIYDCRNNGVIVGQVEGKPYSGRYDHELYAHFLEEIIERYPNLCTLDATPIWGGRMSYDDEEPLQHVMECLCFDDLAPTLKRLLLVPNAAFVTRFLLEYKRGLQVEPPLSHDVMAFIAAGCAYGWGGEDAKEYPTKVTFKVESEYLTNKAHYYAPVRATTPGGTEFEIWWQQRGCGVDDVSMMECFGEEHPDSDAWGPHGDDLDYDHPDFVTFCEKRQETILKSWAEDIRSAPFAHLLHADNGCKSDCCGIKMTKKGEDYHVCSCEHKRPVFMPVGEEEDVDSEDSSASGLCVCER